MSGNKIVDTVYKILPLYENAAKSKSEMIEQAYLAYLSRVYVQFMGINYEFATMVRGLIELGICAEHNDVRRIVFHIIHGLEKEGDIHAV